MADAYFQASLVAERTGHWVLSRNYAERAKSLFQELDDERTVGRLLNNLGGLSLLLGKPRAGDRAAEGVLRGRRRGRLAGATRPRRMGGLATVHLRLGEWDAADEHARQALRLLDGREDFLDEIGQSQLVLGRSLLERDRLDEAEECFRAADATFEQLSSISHRAGVWVALGDLAARRGRGRGGRPAVPERRRSASGHAVLVMKKGGSSMKTRLLFVALSASVLFACVGRGLRPGSSPGPTGVSSVQRG